MTESAAAVDSKESCNPTKVFWQIYRFHQGLPLIDIHLFIGGRIVIWKTTGEVITAG